MSVSVIFVKTSDREDRAWLKVMPSNSVIYSALPSDLKGIPVRTKLADYIDTKQSCILLSGLFNMFDYDYDGYITALKKLLDVVAGLVDSNDFDIKLLIRCDQLSTDKAVVVCHTETELMLALRKPSRVINV